MYVDAKKEKRLSGKASDVGLGETKGGEGDSETARTSKKRGIERNRFNVGVGFCCHYRQTASNNPLLL